MYIYIYTPYTHHAHIRIHNYVKHKQFNRNHCNIVPHIKDTLAATTVTTLVKIEARTNNT